MPISVLRPDDIKRIMSVRGHWGKNPHGAKPDEADAVPLVPIANYGYDDMVGMWLPMPNEGGSSGTVLENEYIMVPIDLGVDRSAAPAEIFWPGMADNVWGRSLTIWTCNGTCELYYTDAAHDAVPIKPLSWPAMISFVRTFQHILIKNDPQADKELLLYIGRHV